MKLIEPYIKDTSIKRYTKDDVFASFDRVFICTQDPDPTLDYNPIPLGNLDNIKPLTASLGVNVFTKFQYLMYDLRILSDNAILVSSGNGINAINHE